MSKTEIGMWVSELLSLKIPEQKRLHPWVPNGLTILAGAPKVGKSTLAEQIALEVSEENNVIYLALEYSIPVAQSRFSRFRNKSVFILLDGDLNRFGKGGENQLKTLLSKVPCDLLIIDVLACLKRTTNGDYAAEYAAFAEIKQAITSFGIDCLALHHTRKGDSSDTHNAFEAIHGSTALSAVPDNLMMLTKRNNQMKLQMKGRLIGEDEINLDFVQGEYFKSDVFRTGHEISAPVFHQILTTLEELGGATTKQLVDATNKSASQISTACKTLEKRGELKNPYKGFYQPANRGV